MEIVKRTYEAAVELFAFLCRKFSLDPMADGVIVSHKEGHDRGIASGHTDPNHLWDGLQSGYTMDGFRHDVNAAMGKTGQAETKTAVCQGTAVKQTAPGRAMVISDKGVDLIAGYEGCRLEAYVCPAGAWTIGYGHTEGVKKEIGWLRKEKQKNC